MKISASISFQSEKSSTHVLNAKMYENAREKKILNGVFWEKVSKIHCILQDFLQSTFLECKCDEQK